MEITAGIGEHGACGPPAPASPDIDLGHEGGLVHRAGQRPRLWALAPGMGLPNMKKYTDEMKVESQVGVGNHRHHDASMSNRRADRIRRPRWTV